MSSSNQSPTDLKKKAGTLIFSINSEILELQQAYCRVKDGGKFSNSDSEKEKVVEEKTVKLKEIVTKLNLMPEYVKEMKLEKVLEMMTVTLENVDRVHSEKAEIDQDTLKDVANTKTEAKNLVDELKADDLKKTTAVEDLASLLSEAVKDGSSNVEDTSSGELAEEAIEHEISCLEKHVQNRFKRIRKELESKMREQSDKLERIWNTERDTIDNIGLKEIKFEFDQIDTSLKYLISDWDRRKHSELLSDFLTDLHHKLWNEYNTKFMTKANIKRIEANADRVKEKELKDYKNEKRRPIPTWPNTVEYTKFKPDLLSWDKEHHLSSGSSKFGQLMEMLKREGKLHTFEQIQARLGKSRNDTDIIVKIVSLLDEINEETTYNKLSRSWDSIINFKKKPSETLNDLFSRFETIQFNLNLADGSFLEPSATASLEEKLLMSTRKLELNDKLKSVLLIKSLGLDSGYKRDILAKINFDRESKEVYEATKIAIRDICGDVITAEQDKDNVLYNKPWSGPGRSRSRSYSGSRSKSPRYYQTRQHEEGRDRGRSRSERRDRGRSYAAGRAKEGKAVSFKRDSTPVPGKEVVTGSDKLKVINNHKSTYFIEKAYDEIYVSSKDMLSVGKLNLFMIVDIGCPRSLMGISQYELFKQLQVIKDKGNLREFPCNEFFKFGPSKPYMSKLRIEVIMYIENVKLEANFFIVEGQVPILLGNDFLESLGGVIHTSSKVLEFTALQEEVNMIKTKGGHFVLPIIDTDRLNTIENWKEDENCPNVRGLEAKAVMVSLLAECSDKREVEKMHDLVGHCSFVALVLEDDRQLKCKKCIGILVTDRPGKFGRCSLKEASLERRRSQ